MKIIRWVLGRVILILDYITRPKKIRRKEEVQKKLNDMFLSHSIYQFYTCPFCVKVRRYLRKNCIDIEYRDARNNIKFREELKSEGGKIQVPCLRIIEGDKKSWLYESSDIIKYFEKIISEHNSN